MMIYVCTLKPEETERDPFRQRDLYFFHSPGFSMLQGGPLPCFLKEEKLQTLLVGEYSILKESEKQFECGLHKFGLIEVIYIQT